MVRGQNDMCRSGKKSSSGGLDSGNTHISRTGCICICKLGSKMTCPSSRSGKKSSSGGSDSGTGGSEGRRDSASGGKSHYTRPLDFYDYNE